MDETNRLNFHLPNLSDATTVGRIVYAPVLSPVASCSAETDDARCSGATYVQYSNDEITPSKPVGGETPTSNSSSDGDLAKPDNNIDQPHRPTTLAQPNPSSQFPDGGLDAWLVTLGCWCVFFISWGPIYTLGIFQAYYHHTLLLGSPSSSPSALACIASTALFTMYAGGLLFGKLFDRHGPRWLLLVGAALHVYGWMMASFATRYYHLFLSQAVCSPLGASCMYYACAGCITTWFWRRRATAFGIAATGAPVGGVVMAGLFVGLVPRVGYPWTMRIIGFLMLGVVVLVNLTVKSRVEHSPRPFRAGEYLEPFRDPAFCLVAGGMAVFVVGLFLPLSFLVLQARSRGLSIALSQYLVLIMNAAGIPGRILATYLAPKLGTFNLTVLTTLLCSLVTLTLWLPRTNHPHTTSIVFAILYGFSASAYVALAPMLVAQISSIRQMGVRSGVLFFVVGVAALIGVPVGGRLLERGEDGWMVMQAFAGGCMGVAAGVLVVAREVALGGRVRRV
ncbi:hypothetical protein XPA_004386 [Xanthoria parietina]